MLRLNYGRCLEVPSSLMLILQSRLGATCACRNLNARSAGDAWLYHICTVSASHLAVESRGPEAKAQSEIQESKDIANIDLEAERAAEAEAQKNEVGVECAVARTGMLH